MRMKKIVENHTLVSLLPEKNASMKKLVRLGALFSSDFPQKQITQVFSWNHFFAPFSVTWARR